LDSCYRHEGLIDVTLHKLKQRERIMRTYEEIKAALIANAIEQIKTDIDNGDYTAIADLLGFFTVETLRDYLEGTES